MENNLTASEQLALLQPTAAGPTPEEKLTTEIRSFTPPSVSGARAELNQIQNLIRDQESRRVNETIAAIAKSNDPNRSPFQPGLSQSQQFTRQRAGQDKIIADAYAKAGVPLTATDLSNMQSQVRQDPTLTEIDPTFLYEKRVADAYKSIGREGDAVDREGFDFFLNKLKSGEISPANFDKEFLGIAANYTGPGASSLLDSINSARAQTGMAPLTLAQLAEAQAAAAKAAAASGGTTPSGGITNVGTTASGGATRDQVLAAYAANPKAVLNPDEEAINFFMQPGNLGNFNTIVDQVRAANPALAASIDATRNPRGTSNNTINTSPKLTPNYGFDSFSSSTTSKSVPNYGFDSFSSDPSKKFVPNYGMDSFALSTPVAPLNPTREQVLAAYAANPKAVLNPDQAAIDFFMQPGKLANFNTIVDEVRAADPALAARIDAERGSARLFRDGGPVKK